MGEFLDYLDRTPAGERHLAWCQFLDLVDRLLDDEEFVWSWGTLTAIRETVLDTRRVTDGQVLAVQRIFAFDEEGGW